MSNRLSGGLPAPDSHPRHASFTSMDNSGILAKTVKIALFSPENSGWNGLGMVGHGLGWDWAKMCCTASRRERSHGSSNLEMEIFSL